MSHYKGTVVHEITEEDVGKALWRLHKAFLGWGFVTESDIGKQMIVDDKQPWMENEAQRDARLAQSK